MKILACHNYYQQRGGEDGSHEAECALLESRGHRVLRYLAHNDDIKQMTRLTVAGKTLWNRETYRELRALIRRERPDVMHCTNTFPLISPAAYDAAGDEGVPVVQSLRNYRLMCVNGYLMRNGRVCEACVGRTFPWRGVVHGCYRGSMLNSAAVALLNGAHRIRGTWTKRVTRYFALTEFGRGKFIEAGLPAARISIKPNFVAPDPGPGAGRGGYALFVGRLSPEKGLTTLLEAWQQLQLPMTLKIAGVGPMEPEVCEAASRDPRIEPLFHVSQAEVMALLSDAAFLILPSLWYEGLPRTIVEAYATGTPVLASDLGAMTSLVAEGRTGGKFPAGDSAALARKVAQVADDPASLRRMREGAREEFVSHYTADRNYAMLMEIYAQAITEVTGHPAGLATGSSTGTGAKHVLA